MKNDDVEKVVVARCDLYTEFRRRSFGAVARESRDHDAILDAILSAMSLCLLRRRDAAAAFLHRLSALPRPLNSQPRDVTTLTDCVTEFSSRSRGRSSVKLAFHDADTDILARILARMWTCRAIRRECPCRCRCRGMRALAYTAVASIFQMDFVDRFPIG